MSVNPGFGGQKFITSFLRRCEVLRSFLVKNNLNHVQIEVDGGVKHDNVSEIARAGASILVCGSGIFEGNIAENIKELRKRAESGFKQIV